MISLKATNILDYKLEMNAIAVTMTVRFYLLKDLNAIFLAVVTLRRLVVVHGE